MAYYERMDEAVRYGPVCRRDIRLSSEQEQQIYKYVLEKGSITTANYLVYSSCVYNHIAAHARTDFIIYRNKKK